MTPTWFVTITTKDECFSFDFETYEDAIYFYNHYEMNEYNVIVSLSVAINTKKLNEGI